MRAPSVGPSFALDVEIAAPMRCVLDFLGDLENLRDLHPLIQEIRELPRRPDRPAARHYEILDRVPLGPVRLATTYRAAIEAVSETELWATAWQSPGVELDTRYVAEERSAGMRLHERVWVRTPRWLPGLDRFVRHQAEAAHRVTLDRLSAHLARA